MTARVPPHDRDAEESLLGAMLLSRGAIDDAIAAGVTAGDFYVPRHGVMYGAIIDMSANGAVDPVTVASHLTDLGAGVSIGDDPAQVLRKIQANTPASANAPAYAATVRKCAHRRRLIELAAHLQDAVYDDTPVDAVARELDALAQLPDGVRTDAATSWCPVDLIAALEGQAPPPATLFTRDDGVALLYPGRVHWFWGESESCKSWAAQYATAQILDAGGRACWIDYEDDEGSLVERLRAMGLTTDRISQGLVYVRPDEPLADHQGRPAPAARDFAALLRQPFSLAVIDGITEAMVTEGLDLNDNADTAAFMRRLPRPFADAGAAVVCVDHVTKAGDQRGHYAIGAQHKRAGISGAAYAFKVSRPLHRAVGADPVEAAITITVEKDRPGHVRAAAIDARVATMNITAYPDGGITVALVAPTERPEAPPPKLLEAILGHLRLYDGASGRNILEGVSGNTETIRAALKWMAAQEPPWICATKKGNAHLHFLTDEGRER